MKKYFHIAGHAACFIALLAMLGGHWLVLQSIAWTRMVAKYAEQNSLTTALSKTFDGKHPCPMCLEIRDGRQQEQQQEKNGFLTKENKMTELFWEPRSLTLPLRDLAVTVLPQDGDSFYREYCEPPPTPPPRSPAAA